jgi:predicted O-methyltransferase YrrM
MNGLEFTNDWFSEAARPVWDQLIPQVQPARILEVGSYEGASVCYLIETLAPRHPLEIHCIDTWLGSPEHKGIDMQAVEARFQRNLERITSVFPERVNLRVHKGLSCVKLARLLADGKQGYFDFIYIDGSHQAPDVLCDAVLAFQLLKIGGVIVFDDYLWRESDPLMCPKVAIDAFTNMYMRKLHIMTAPLYQLYAQKILD